MRTDSDRFLAPLGGVEFGVGATDRQYLTVPESRRRVTYCLLQATGTSQVLVDGS